MRKNNPEAAELVEAGQLGGHRSRLEIRRCAYTHATTKEPVSGMKGGMKAHTVFVNVYRLITSVALLLHETFLAYAPTSFVTRSSRRRA